MKDAIVYVAFLMFAVGAMWQMYRLGRRLSQLEAIIEELYTRDDILKRHLVAVESGLRGRRGASEPPLGKVAGE